jgi:hypothetical protein
MAPPRGRFVRRIWLAAAVAGIPALLLAAPEIGGVATWKVLLAAAGLALFVVAGRSSPRP